MLINFKVVYQEPTEFFKLTGITLAEFHNLCKRIRVLSQSLPNPKIKKNSQAYLELELVDKLLAVLLYYRTSTSYTFISQLFGVSRTTLARWINKYEPLLSELTSIKTMPYFTEEMLIEHLLAITKKAKKPTFFECIKSKYFSFKLIILKIMKK